MDEAEKAARRALAIQKLASVFSKAGCLPHQQGGAGGNKARQGLRPSTTTRQDDSPKSDDADDSSSPEFINEDRHAALPRYFDAGEVEFLLQLLGELQSWTVAPSLAGGLLNVPVGRNLVNSLPPPNSPAPVHTVDNDDASASPADRLAGLIRARIADISAPGQCQGAGREMCVQDGMPLLAGREGGAETQASRQTGRPEGERMDSNRDAAIAGPAMRDGHRLATSNVRSTLSTAVQDGYVTDALALRAAEPNQMSSSAVERSAWVSAEGLSSRTGGVPCAPGGGASNTPHKGAVAARQGGGGGGGGGGKLKLGPLLRDIALGKAGPPNPVIATAEFWETLSGGRMTVGKPGLVTDDRSSSGAGCASRGGEGAPMPNRDVCRLATGRVDIARAQAMLDEQGYVATRPFGPEDWRAHGVDLDAMLHTMNALVEAGWPPAFIFMYDMAWAMVDALFSYMCHFVGSTRDATDILLEPSNFAWALRPAAATSSHIPVAPAATQGAQGPPRASPTADGGEEAARQAGGQAGNSLPGVAIPSGTNRAAASSQHGTVSNSVPGHRPSAAGNNFGLPHRDYSYGESWLEPEVSTGMADCHGAVLVQLVPCAI
eukprot:jgi/Mesvir1/17986/Mv09329-RA.1